MLCTTGKGFGETCSLDDQCPTNAECSGSTCACPADRYQDSNQCSPSMYNANGYITTHATSSYDFEMR